MTPFPAPARGGYDGLVDDDVVIGNDHGPPDVNQNPDIVAGGSAPAASEIAGPGTLALFGPLLGGMTLARRTAGPRRNA